jgi:hypothetical protein
MVVATAAAGGGGGVVLLSPLVAFVTLIQVPHDDLEALGFPVSSVRNSHPVGAIISALPVLPPVSRPAMRTLNLKTGQPYVVEGVRCLFPSFLSFCLSRSIGSFTNVEFLDSITAEYQNILGYVNSLRTAYDRNTVWQKYTEYHMAIERIMLAQRSVRPSTHITYGPLSLRPRQRLRSNNKLAPCELLGEPSEEQQHCDQTDRCDIHAEPVGRQKRHGVRFSDREGNTMQRPDQARVDG